MSGRGTVPIRPSGKMLSADVGPVYINLHPEHKLLSQTIHR